MSTLQEPVTGEGILAMMPGLPTILATSLALLFILYRRMLPKPLPGIPYNEKAVGSILGDVPALLAHLKKSGDDATAWLHEQVHKSNSPISQLFLAWPFWKPVVVISDAREIEDILMRTPKDFDRSEMLRGFFWGAAPDFHVMLPTGEKWKAHRRLVHDLMTPSFLRHTASGAIYEKAVELILLWEVKMEIAAGRAFSAKEDIHFAALDAFMGFSFGDGSHAREISSRVSLLAEMSDDQRGKLGSGNGITSRDAIVEFPKPEIDTNMEFVMKLGRSVEDVRKSIFKILRWRYLRATSLRKPLKEKRRFFLELLDISLKRMEQHAPDDDSWVRSSLDHIVATERRIARKEGRAPDYLSSMVMEEAYGFVGAGHDSTSTTVMWAVKTLADQPQHQTKLRSALQDAFPRALAEGRLPTNDEIHDTNIAYLDAAMEELLRFSPPVPVISRTTVQDTLVLGHVIPKGTTLMLQAMTMHGSHIPPFPIDECKRSERSRSAKLQQGKSTPAWDEDDMGEYKPERWLKQDDQGRARFDPMAGPNLVFGLGLRGCFGRKMAYLELRTLLVLIVWRFVLEPCPEGVSGYAAVPGITRFPKLCYVRLKRAY